MNFFLRGNRDKDSTVQLTDSFMLSESGKDFLQRRLGSSDVITAILTILQTERGMSGRSIQEQLSRQGYVVKDEKMKEHLQKLFDHMLILDTTLSGRDSSDGMDDSFGDDLE